MRAKGSPIVLSDYCMEHRALIFQVTAKKLFNLNGNNPTTLSLLGLRQTYHTYATLVGMNGFTIVLNLPSTRFKKNVLVIV